MCFGQYVSDCCGSYSAASASDFPAGRCLVEVPIFSSAIPEVKAVADFLYTKSVEHRFVAGVARLRASHHKPRILANPATPIP
jgi:hypothetical protein